MTQSAHALHLVEATVFMVVALAGVALVEHLQTRRPSRLMVLIAATGAASGGIHLAVMPSHWTEDVSYGLFFLVAAVAQLSYSVLLLVRPRRALVAVYVGGNLAILLLWVQTRTLGVPTGAAAGLREPVGGLDLLSAVLELTIVIAGVAVLSRPTRRAGVQASVSA